jgi:hypothetical protein
MQQVILFLREGKFAARVQRVRNPSSKKKIHILLTSCIQKFFGARKFR